MFDILFKTSTDPHLIPTRPVYFQAAKLASPLLSGVYFFPTVVAISPSAVIQGIITSKTGKYRMLVRRINIDRHVLSAEWFVISFTQNVIGWCAMLLGIGLLCTLSSRSPIGVTVPFQMITAVGFGFVYSTTFTVLAPLDVSSNAQALSFLLFARTFSQVFFSA